jgi:hypothetical protein
MDATVHISPHCIKIFHLQSQQNTILEYVFIISLILSHKYYPVKNEN